MVRLGEGTSYLRSRKNLTKLLLFKAWKTAIANFTSGDFWTSSRNVITSLRKKNKNEVIFLQQVVINKKVIKGKRGCSNLLTSRISAMPEHKNPSTFVNPPVQLIHHANLDKLQQRDGPSWLTTSQVTGHISNLHSLFNGKLHTWETATANWTYLKISPSFKFNKMS